MAERAGLEDVLLAFAIIGGVMTLADFLDRRSNRAENEKKHRETQARLAAMEITLGDIRGKLG